MWDYFWYAALIIFTRSLFSHSLPAALRVWPVQIQRREYILYQYLFENNFGLHSCGCLIGQSAAFSHSLAFIPPSQPTTGALTQQTHLEFIREHA